MNKIIVDSTAKDTLAFKEALKGDRRVLNVYQTHTDHAISKGILSFDDIAGGLGNIRVPKGDIDNLFKEAVRTKFVEQTVKTFEESDLQVDMKIFSEDVYLLLFPPLDNSDVKIGAETFIEEYREEQLSDVDFESINLISEHDIMENSTESKKKFLHIIEEGERHSSVRMNRIKTFINAQLTSGNPEYACRQIIGVLQKIGNVKKIPDEVIREAVKWEDGASMIQLYQHFYIKILPINAKQHSASN